MRAAASAPRHGVGDGARKGGEAMPDGSAVCVKPRKLRMLPGLGMMGAVGGPDAIRPAQRKRTQHGAQPGTETARNEGLRSGSCNLLRIASVKRSLKRKIMRGRNERKKQKNPKDPLVQEPATLRSSAKARNFHILDRELVVVRNLFARVEIALGVDDNLRLVGHLDDLRVAVGLHNDRLCCVGSRPRGPDGQVCGPWAHLAAVVDEARQVTFLSGICHAVPHKFAFQRELMILATATLRVLPIT